MFMSFKKKRTGDELSKRLKYYNQQFFWRGGHVVKFEFTGYVLKQNLQHLL